VTGSSPRPLSGPPGGHAPPFNYEVAELPITVAALMTTTWIAKHLPAPMDFFW